MYFIYKMLINLANSAWVRSIVQQYFPEIYKRMVEDMDAVCRKHGLEKPPFHPFWNFCINSPLFEEKIQNVICRPHQTL